MLLNEARYAAPKIDPARLSIMSASFGEKVLWKVLLDGNLWAVFPTKSKALEFVSKGN